MKRTLIVLFLALPLSAQTIFVDASDAKRGVFHSHMTIPAKSGAMTLVYPKWIPGEHTPTGPLMQVAGLRIKDVEWTRDPIEMFSFHVSVPANMPSLEVDLDYISPMSNFAGGYGESANATQHLLLLLFNHLVLYPSGVPTDQLTYTASVKLPAGWKFDTALPVRAQNGDRVDFAPVSLTTLIDSPLVAGEFQRVIPIADNGRERLTITADSASALQLDV